LNFDKIQKGRIVPESKNLASPSERVKESSILLTGVASKLNSASDRLAKSIQELDAFLKEFGLGVSSFVNFRSWTSQDGMEYDYDALGYAKTNGKWGLTIKTRSGHQMADHEAGETWLYNEAPRLLRVKAAKAIPELLEKLIKDAEKMSADVDAQAEQVDAMTKALAEGRSVEDKTARKITNLFEPDKGFTVRDVISTAGTKTERGKK
jgi:hypothetical protein